MRNLPVEVVDCVAIVQFFVDATDTCSDMEDSLVLRCSVGKRLAGYVSTPKHIIGGDAIVASRRVPLHLLEPGGTSD